MMTAEDVAKHMPQASCPADRALEQYRIARVAERRERRVEWAQIAAMAVVVVGLLWMMGALSK